MQSAKVAQDAASAADRKRGPLSATLPQPNTAITKRTLRECIPRECFVRSYIHSFAALGWDLFMVVVASLCVSWAAGALPAVLVPFAWLGYWWYQVRPHFPSERNRHTHRTHTHRRASPALGCGSLPTSAATAASPTRGW